MNFRSTFNIYIKISVSAFPCVYKNAGGQGKGNLSDDLAAPSQAEGITSPMFLKIAGAQLTSK